jgi:hypothetical protein
MIDFKINYRASNPVSAKTLTATETSIIESC